MLIGWARACEKVRKKSRCWLVKSQSTKESQSLVGWASAGRNLTSKIKTNTFKQAHVGPTFFNLKMVRKGWVLVVHELILEFLMRVSGTSVSLFWRLRISFVGNESLPFPDFAFDPLCFLLYFCYLAIFWPLLGVGMHCLILIDYVLEMVLWFSFCSFTFYMAVLLRKIIEYLPVSKKSQLVWSPRYYNTCIFQK